MLQIGPDQSYWLIPKWKPAVFHTGESGVLGFPTPSSSFFFKLYNKSFSDKAKISTIALCNILSHRVNIAVGMNSRNYNIIMKLEMWNFALKYTT